MNNIQSRFDHLLIRDSVLRSSSVPSFFEQYQGYMDGGAFANNPSGAGIALACGESGLKIPLDNIALLSLGYCFFVKFLVLENFLNHILSAKIMRMLDYLDGFLMGLQFFKKLKTNGMLLNLIYS